MSTPIVTYRFHHVGLACSALQPEIHVHQMLGYRIEGQPFYDPIQQINGIFLVHGGMRIELIEPAGDKSPIHNLLAKGIKMYHQCFEVDHLQTSIAALEQQGACLITSPAPAIAFNGREIAFLMLRTRLIVELIAS